MRPAPTPWGSISLEAAGQAAQAASSRRAPGRPKLCGPRPRLGGSISLEAAGQAAQAASSRRAPGRSQAVRPAPTPWGSISLEAAGQAAQAASSRRAPGGPKLCGPRPHLGGSISPEAALPFFKVRRAGSTGQARRFLFYLQYTTDEGKRKQTGVGLPVGYLKMNGPLAWREAHPVEGGHRSHKQPRAPRGPMTWMAQPGALPALYPVAGHLMASPGPPFWS